ncbi:MAG: ribonuclease HII [Chloroflexota bacterium]|jgi:ribonuclease HII|nr:ribonuclease HII [Chloroflexota bacterium]
MMAREKFDLSLLPDRPDLTFEQVLWKNGKRLVAGVDEAGRGALAGPVAVGAVVLPGNRPDLFDQLHGVRDSKEMTPEDRETWAAVIKKIALYWGVGFASNDEIDELGIAPAIYLAASRALEKLGCAVEHVLVDYITLPDVAAPQTPLVKGDARSLSIAAASILAKTTRDARLVEMDSEYPGYHFISNKGYATKQHIQAIDWLGPCDQHRKTFSPVQDYFLLFPPEVEG